MKELWKSIIGFEGLYEISTHGNIKSLKRKGKIKKNATHPKTGYILNNLCKNNVKYTRLVHRLMAIAFLPNPKNKLTVNHIDGVKANNQIYNLEWATHSEQNKHASKLGLKKYHGEHHSQHTLTEQQVLEIRWRNLRGQSYRQIAKDYPVCKGTIGDVVRRRSWTYI